MMPALACTETSFSVDAAVRIEGNDRAGLERLLRYCARPPFALEHLHQRDAGHLVYHCSKPRPDGSGDLVLTPLELINRIAALVPRLWPHRHRYYGVLAPNAPLRAAVTALAPAAVPPAPTFAAGGEDPSLRTAARYLWAMLLARIYEAFPLACPICHAKMRIIAFINETDTIIKKNPRHPEDQIVHSAAGLCILREAASSNPALVSHSECIRCYSLSLVATGAQSGSQIVRCLPFLNVLSTMNVNGAGHFPQPFPMAHGAVMMAAESAPMPVEAGESNVTVNVSGQIELGD